MQNGRTSSDAHQRVTRLPGNEETGRMRSRGGIGLSSGLTDAESGDAKTDERKNPRAGINETWLRMPTDDRLWDRLVREFINSFEGGRHPAAGQRLMAFSFGTGGAGRRKP